MKVGFLVTPVGLMMGNVESAKRLRGALSARGVSVVDAKESQECDLLHVHTPFPPGNFKIVRNAKRLGQPVVIHAHTTAEDSVGTWTGSSTLSGVTGRYLTRFYNLGDLVLAPSAWTKARLVERGVRAPIRVLSNGVDLCRFSFDQERRDRFRRRYSIPGGATVAYSVGVACLKKGIEVFPEVANAEPEVHFIWIGRRSKLYHPFKVNRAISGLGANARFLSDVDDIVDAHCGGDIFITPSFVENQGIAVMEAMAVGRPIVARDLPSYRGLLADERTALLCTSSDGFASAIERLCDDPRLRSDLVESAKGAIQMHSIDKVAEQLETVYASLIDSKAQFRGARA